MKKTLVKRSIRVDEPTLEQLKKLLGIQDESKVIRASMNFTNNVAHKLCNGNWNHMFKRKKRNEEVELYDQNL